MERVLSDTREAQVHVLVDYHVEKGLFYMLAFLCLLPVVGLLIMYGVEMVWHPEEIAIWGPAFAILSSGGGAGLLFWTLWSTHKQEITVQAGEGVIQSKDTFGFLPVRRRYRLADVTDLFEDSAPAENPGEKHFLRLHLASGRQVKLTRPSPRVTKDAVDQVYAALRPYCTQLPPLQRLGHFPRLQVTETPVQVTIAFRTRLRFITVRYYGTLLLALAFFGAATALNVFAFYADPVLVLYPGLVIECLPLAFLAMLWPWRAKYLAHNRNMATFQVTRDQSGAAIRVKERISIREFPSIPLDALREVQVVTDHELTFSRRRAREFTSYYLIILHVKSVAAGISLYETESEAEAMHVVTYLKSLIHSRAADPVSNAIEEAKRRTLPLADAAQDAGGPPFSEATWDRAADFIRQVTQKVQDRAGFRLPLPFIGASVGKGILLNWKAEHYNLTVVVPEYLRATPDVFTDSTQRIPIRNFQYTLPELIPVIVMWFELIT